MSHYRQQVREAVATLVTGLTTTGSNVFQTRIYPIAAGSLPSLSVYTDGEEVDEDMAATGDHRVVAIRVRIDARSKKVSDLDDQMDTILSEVQAAIAADQTLSGKAYQVMYAGLDDPEYSGEGDTEHALFTINYTALTGFDITDPETITL